MYHVMKGFKMLKKLKKYNGKMLRKKILPVFCALTMTTSLLSGCGKGDDLSAITMRLQRLVGTVNLFDENGKALSLQEQMKLLSGQTLATATQSLVMVALDDTKLITVEEDSKATVEKNGNALKLEITEGNVFINVTEKLDADATFDISTGNMLCGIRGTSEYIGYDEYGHAQVMATDGKTHGKAKHPITGEEIEFDILPGDSVTIFLDEEAEGDSSISATKRAYKIEELPPLALDSMAKNAELRERVAEALNVPAEKIIKLAECMSYEGKSMYGEEADKLQQEGITDSIPYMGTAGDEITSAAVEAEELSDNDLDVEIAILSGSKGVMDEGIAAGFEDKEITGLMTVAKEGMTKLVDSIKKAGLDKKDLVAVVNATSQMLVTAVKDAATQGGATAALAAVNTTGNSIVEIVDDSANNGAVGTDLASSILKMNDADAQAGTDTAQAVTGDAGEGAGGATANNGTATGTNTGRTGRTAGTGQGNTGNAADADNTQTVTPVNTTGTTPVPTPAVTNPPATGNSGSSGGSDSGSSSDDSGGSDSGSDSGSSSGSDSGGGSGGSGGGDSGGSSGGGGSGGDSGGGSSGGGSSEDPTTTTYTVTLDAQGGTINSGNVTSYTAGTETALPTDVTKANYSFDGWYTEASGGSKVTAIGSSESGNKTYYAHWISSTAATYTVSAVAETGGSVTTLVNSAITSTASAGDSVELRATSETGYSFEHWMDGDGGEGSVSLDNIIDTSDSSALSNPSLQFTMPAGNVAVRARFAPRFYSVNLDPMGGTIAEGYDVTSYNYGSTVTLPDATKVTKASTSQYSYEFLGWFTETTGGTQVTQISGTEAQDINLYAHWQQAVLVSHDITYGSDTTDVFAYVDDQVVTSAAAGETVTLRMSRNTGMALVNFTINEDEVQATLNSDYNYEYTFEMPDYDITVDMIAEESEFNYYTSGSCAQASVFPGSDSLEEDGSGSALPDDTVQVRVLMNSGVAIDSVSVTIRSGSNINVESDEVSYELQGGDVQQSDTEMFIVFTMPPADVDVAVTFK